MGYNPAKQCSGQLDNNKAFHVPKTTGGKSNQPGTYAVVALGGWQKVTSGGVVVEQAAAELYGAVGLHEIGHNGDLWHGGPPATWNPTTRLFSFEPNCKPVNVTVMNYVFQVTGAKKDNDTRTYFDYSRDPEPSASVNTLDKNHLSDVPFGTPLSYRTAWFAPPTFAGATAAKRYCNGTPFGSNPNPNLARFNGPLTTDPNDYNANGDTNDFDTRRT